MKELEIAARLAAIHEAVTTAPTEDIRLLADSLDSTISVANNMIPNPSGRQSNYHQLVSYFRVYVQRELQIRGSAG